MKSLYVFPRRLVASEVRINHHEGIGLGEVSASVGELKLYSASRRGYVVVTASPDWLSGSVLDVVSRCLPLGAVQCQCYCCNAAPNPRFWSPYSLGRCGNFSLLGVVTHPPAWVVTYP